MKYLIKYISREKESQLKVESIVDIVIQLSNVGLITTDTINSDLGIESRTPFTRKLVEFITLTNIKTYKFLK